MGILMTDDAMKRLTKLRQRERIRRCSIEDKKNVAISFEELAYPIAQPPRPVIIAVRCYGTGIGFRQGSGGFRADPGGVVARKFLMQRSHPVSRYPSFGFRAIAMSRNTPVFANGEARFTVRT